MQDQEGFYFTGPNESIWALEPKSLREVLEEKPIWRDPATGLPMHSQHDAETIPIREANGMIRYAEREFLYPYRPCNCGIKGYDIPLSAAPKRKEY